MSETAQDTTRVQQAGRAAGAEASATADQAQQAAGQVAGTAMDQAKAVAGKAQQQAGKVADDLRRRAMDEAGGQTRRAAGVLHQWADDVAGLADNAPSDSPARSLAARAADSGHRTADYLEKQGADGVLSDVQSFARRRPAAFLGGALLAGFAVGRMAKVAAKSDTPSRTQPEALGSQRPALNEPGSAALAAAPSQGTAQEPVPAVSPAAAQPLGRPQGDAPGRPGPGV
ncbi:hypothetical protein B6E66_14270 [Streptomyces maremycinicus]|nr:hypothetical protein B6E66_14270 [Streptomyces sp. B9173]